MASVVTHVVREPVYRYKRRYYGLGPGKCKRRGCGAETATGDVAYCPKHWERTYHCAYPAITWRSEHDKLLDWTSGVPTPNQESDPETVYE